MSTIAKFECLSRKEYASNVWDKGHKVSSPDGFLYAYEFQVVHGDSDENNQFFGSTPGGTISMTAVRDDLFVPGKRYYVKFEQAAE